MSDILETVSFRDHFYAVTQERPGSDSTFTLEEFDTYDSASKTEKVTGYDYFYITSSSNPTQDIGRQISEQKVKFYPVIDVSSSYTPVDVTWDVDAADVNIQKVLGMGYFVAASINPAQSTKRGLDSQQIKFYHTIDVTYDNPPNIVTKVKGTFFFTAISNNEPEQIEETLFIEDSFTALGSDDPDIVMAIVRIKPTFSVDGGDGGDGGDEGLADTSEYLINFIYITPTFKTEETIFYQTICAIASWADNTNDGFARINEKVIIHFTHENEELNPYGIDITVNVKDFLKISTEQLANLLEYVRISDHYYTKGGSSDEATITYVVNEGNETTRYEHWPFESYAAFKGMYLGCCADGVYVLSGDNDNGEPIEAMINFGKQSFGSANYKRVPYVYASLAGDGDVYLQVSYNEDEQYMYPARKVDEYNATARFDLGRGIKANYLTFELYNENGSKFDLRNLWIYLTELSRRI